MKTSQLSGDRTVTVKKQQGQLTVTEILDGQIRRVYFVSKKRHSAARQVHASPMTHHSASRTRTRRRNCS